MTRTAYRFNAISSLEDGVTEELTMEGTLMETDTLGMTRNRLVEPFLRWLEGLGYNVEDMRDHAEAPF